MTIATKEQELKALSKIKKIVENLGENSYIGMAFEGCFEIAEDNIGNDFGSSMKQRAESAERKTDELADRLAESEKDCEAAHEAAHLVAEEKDAEIERLKGKVLTTAETGAIKAILHYAKLEAAAVADRSAEKIVELADNPESTEFRQAVLDNRASKKRLAECDTLIQRLLETMA